jgi:tetratricopeptide (TPR) repeat protein
MMLVRSIVFALALSTGAALAAAPARDDPQRTGPAAATAPAAPDDTANLSRSDRLNRYFDTLKDDPSAEAAKDAERAIIRIWMQSGSDTVDLLMDWAVKAIAEKNYPLALDYLDRVTVLMPDYAEGWNRRATVYFLLDDYGKSLTDIARTLELEPRHFGALAGLGAILVELGEKNRAIGIYKQALAIDPLLSEVRKSLDELESDGTNI